MRNSAKKNSATHLTQINAMIRTSAAGLMPSDEKVKKSGSSQSLMKMQAAQLISAQMKEMSRKTLGIKKSNEGLMSTAKQPVRRVVDAHKSANKPVYFASFNGSKGKTPSQQDKLSQER